MYQTVDENTESNRLVSRHTMTAKHCYKQLGRQSYPILPCVVVVVYLLISYLCMHLFSGSSLRAAVRAWSRFSFKSRTKAALSFTRQTIPVLNQTRPRCLDIVTRKVFLRGNISHVLGHQSRGKKRYRILQDHLDCRRICPRT